MLSWNWAREIIHQDGIVPEIGGEDNENKGEKRLRRKLLGLEGTSGGHWSSLLFKAGSGRRPDQLKAPPSCVSDEEHPVSLINLFQCLTDFSNISLPMSMENFTFLNLLILSLVLLSFTTAKNGPVFGKPPCMSWQAISLPLSLLPICRELEENVRWTREEKPSEGLIREKRNRVKEGKEWRDNLRCHLGRG